MPVPSNTFFPQSLQERAAWLQAFVNNLTPIATTLGLTPAEVSDLGLDNEDFQSIAQTTPEVDAFRSAVREYRLSLTESPVGSPHPMFPFSNFNGPQNNRPAGLFQRLMELIERIRAAPAFTDEIGASLGIMPAQSNGISPADVKPAIEVFPSQTGYMFSIIVSDRAESDAWTVSIQPKGGEWSNAGTFTGKSADVTYAPAAPGNPVAVSVRVQLKKKNANYGQLSDIVAFTVNP